MGMPMKAVPNHWKGENGIYCTGFARQGLSGISNDAKKIAEDINSVLNEYKRNNWKSCFLVIHSPFTYNLGFVIYVKWHGFKPILIDFGVKPIALNQPYLSCMI